MDLLIFSNTNRNVIRLQPYQKQTNEILDTVLLICLVSREVNPVNFMYIMLFDQNFIRLRVLTSIFLPCHSLTLLPSHNGYPIFIYL